MEISAQDTFTAPRYKNGGEGFSLSISGTFSGSVTIQRSRGPNGPWRDVESFSAPVERDGINLTSHFIRAGFKSGDYISGTAVVHVF